MEEFLALLVIGFVVWLFMDHPLFSRFTGERNIYPMTCKVDPTNQVKPTNSFFSITCPKGNKPLAIGRISYIANQERQQVVELATGNTLRYDDCKIYDADNWFCHHTGLDIGKRISMNDGEFFNDALTSTIYVSKIKWYWYTVSEIITPAPPVSTKPATDPAARLKELREKHLKK